MTATGTMRMTLAASEPRLPEPAFSQTVEIAQNNGARRRRRSARLASDAAPRAGRLIDTTTRR